MWKSLMLPIQQNISRKMTEGTNRKRQIEKAILPVEKRKGLRYNNTNEVREEIP